MLLIFPPDFLVGLPSAGLTREISRFPWSMSVILVNDVDAAIAWYTKHLAFEVISNVAPVLGV